MVAIMIKTARRLSSLLALLAALTFPAGLASQTGDPANTAEILAAARKAIGERQDRKAFELFKKAAEAGNAEAVLILAKFYFSGIGTARDRQKAEIWLSRAVKNGDPETQNLRGLVALAPRTGAPDLPAAATWFRKSAAQGHADGQYNLAELHAFDRGVEKDMDLAISLYRQAAEKGNTDAQLRLSRMYHSGTLLPRDIDLAIRYAKQAARGGKMEAAVMLRVAYKNGYGVEKDIEESLKWLRIGTEKASVKAIYDLAMTYVRGRDGKIKQDEIALALLQQAARRDDRPSIRALIHLYRLDKSNVGYLASTIPLYERAVDLGDAKLTHEFARMHLFGHLVRKDENYAAELFLKTARNGHAESQVELGILYSERQDPADSIKWFRRASEQGHVRAQYLLSRIYLAKSPPSTYPEAHRLMGLAAARGHVPAMSKLGRLLLDGHTFGLDKEAGIKWIVAAAKAGDASAQFRYGDALFYGNHVKQDYAAAVPWVTKAAEQEHPDALGLLARIYHNGFGVKKDVKRAKVLTDKAIRSGNIDLLYPIALSLTQTGRPRSLVSAYAITSVIMRYSVKRSSHHIKARALRDQIEPQLSAEHLARAKRKDETMYRMIKGMRAEFN